MPRRIKKMVIWYMVAVMFILGITPRIEAGFAPSATINLPTAERMADLKKIQKVLQIKMVKERLKQLGFTEESIQNRLQQLTDEQLHQFALKLDELQVGGNGEVVISLFVIAILIVILIYLLGHRIVIKKG
ncbi:MAG: PA2779 family protein [Thermodesulfobacteriota bacterium]